MTELRLGLANYSVEQWALLKKVANDPDQMNDSYEDWLAGLEKAFRSFESKGYHPVLVDIEVTELMTWCQINGWKLDGKARAEFCRQKMQEMNSQEGCGS